MSAADKEEVAHCDRCGRGATKDRPVVSVPVADGSILQACWGCAIGAERDLIVVQHDPVEHPAHYTMGAIEVIDAIEAWDLNFNRGNVVKYVARAGRKHPTKEIEDLKKAQFYLDHEIKRLEK